MSKEEWENAYQTAWDIYYTDEHLETIIRRAYATGINLWSLRVVLFWFSGAVPTEGVHPLQWGIFRMKYRRDRRSGMPIENPVVFYSKYAADIARKLIIVGKRWRHLTRLINKVQSDPAAKFYMDNALTPVADEDAEHMGLYTQNEAARTAVARELRVAGRKPNGNGNGQPALTVKANGNGKAAAAGNGHDNGDERAADRPETEPRPENTLPPV